MGDDNLHKKIGIDMGKEMLKVTLTLFADDDESSSSANTEKGSKKKDFKNTGNKRVIILASVPKVNENYSNIKILLNLLNLKLLETYWITGKIKKIIKVFVLDIWPLDKNLKYLLFFC